MDATLPRIDAEPDADEQLALARMLRYVEEECRRLGAFEAARHAGLAARMLPEPPTRPAVPAEWRLKGLRLN